MAKVSFCTFPPMKGHDASHVLFYLRNWNEITLDLDKTKIVYFDGVRIEGKQMMEDRFQVGVISSTHGIAGEVKVFPTTDDVKRFKKLKQVILDTGKEELNLEISQVKFFKQMVILKFKEFNNINEVERFRGKSLYVTRENAVKLQKDEYFIADMIGMKVVSTEGEDMGILHDVLQTGANDVYVVQKSGCPELLLPAIKDCVRDVDMEQGIITVYLMPGLRD